METPQRPLTRVKATPELFVPKVLNKYLDFEEIKSFTPDQMVDISRAGKWGNPFPLEKGATDEAREECILKYSEWLMTQGELLDAIGELTGKCLICTCAPKACHGDILLVIANPPPEFKLKRVVKKSAKTGTISRVKVRQAVSRVKAKEKPKAGLVRVRVDVHNTGRIGEPERVIDVPREDEKAAGAIIAEWSNWSKYDELWHFGGLSYNQESYQENADRVRLYYEWKYSHPGPDICEMTPFGAFLSGFRIGMAYSKEQITPEQIKEWKTERAKRRVLDQQDPRYDDIPF